MRRTLNEVWRLCQKAAEGAGAPAGLDADAADGAVWLLARGFDVMGALAAALEALDAGAGTCAFEGEPGGGVLDAAGRPGAIVAPALVDLLVARAGAPLTITGLSAPLFLLPSAARYAEDGWRLRFALDGPGAMGTLLLASPEAGPAILGPPGVEAAWAALAGAAGFTVEAVAASSADVSDVPGDGSLRVLADAGSLAATAARSLAEGLVIGAAPWARLEVFADRMLVPATAESRRRGAGAQASDNE